MRSVKKTSEQRLLARTRRALLELLRDPNDRRGVGLEIDSAICSYGILAVRRAVEIAVANPNVTDRWFYAKGALTKAEGNYLDVLGQCLRLESSLRGRIILALTAGVGPNWYRRPGLYLKERSFGRFARGQLHPKPELGVTPDGTLALPARLPKGKSVEEFMSDASMAVLLEMAYVIAYERRITDLFLDIHGKPIDAEVAESWLDRVLRLRNAASHGKALQEMLYRDDYLRAVGDITRVAEALSRSSQRLLE